MLATIIESYDVQYVSSVSLFGEILSIDMW